MRPMTAMIAVVVIAVVVVVVGAWGEGDAAKDLCEAGFAEGNELLAGGYG